MPADTTDPHQSGDIVPLSTVPRAELARCGAELVALAERFYYGIFVGALGFVSVSTLASLAFLPLRTSAESGRPPPSALIAGLVVLGLAALAIRRAQDVYTALRRWPHLELVPVTIAAVLLSVVSPLRNELWWSACAILMVLALLIPLRRALAYCLIVLLANLAAHLFTGDLHETSAVGIVGLWIGLPFWTAMAAVIPDRMAAHILHLNARTSTAPAPRLAKVSTTPAAAAASTPGEQVRQSRGTARPSPAPRNAPPNAMPAALTAPQPGRTSCLTARQLEVVALLADGHRYLYVAACLSISAQQVQRHVASAIRRTGVSSASELVAVAVAEGIVPPRESPH